MTTVEEPVESGGSRVSRDALRGFFREMLLIRRFEEKVEDRFRAGELPGFLHVAIGQEASATGVCAALRREDVIASTHRAHGHAIAKGTPVERIMAELYGKVEGCSGGYGGSMHLYDVEVGNLGANAVVGGGLPGIVGAALAFQMRGEKRVAVASWPIATCRNPGSSPARKRSSTLSSNRRMSSISRKKPRRASRDTRLPPDSTGSSTVVIERPLC